MDEIMDWLTAVAAVDERPAVREIAGKTAAEVVRLREAIVAYVASEDADIWEQERTWEALCAIARATEGEP